MKYEPLQQLDALAKSWGTKDVTILKRLAAPERFTRLLRDIAASDELMAVASQHSFAHPNGFDRIVLYKDGQAGELRLHVWWHGIPNEEWVHSHLWSFRSIILMGELHYQVFSESPAGQPFSRYRLPATSSMGHYVFEYSGQTRLSVVFEGKATAGTAYWLSGRVFHRILAAPDSESPLATLVARGPLESDYSEVMVQDGVKVPPMRSLSLFRPAEVIDRLHAICNYL